MPGSSWRDGDWTSGSWTGIWEWSGGIGSYTHGYLIRWFIIKGYSPIYCSSIFALLVSFIWHIGWTKFLRFYLRQGVNCIGAQFFMVNHDIKQPCLCLGIGLAITAGIKGIVLGVVVGIGVVGTGEVGIGTEGIWNRIWISIIYV